jgi:hypothetical protein
VTEQQLMDEMMLKEKSNDTRSRRDLSATNRQ